MSFAKTHSGNFSLPQPRDLRPHLNKDTVRTMVIAMHKQNLSIYDISQALSTKGYAVSPVGVSNILKEESFARLPRRKDDERPAGTRPTVADVADVRQLDLSPHKPTIRCRGFNTVPVYALARQRP